jgi:hypothetical protein
MKANRKKLGFFKYKTGLNENFQKIYGITQINELLYLIDS